MEWIYRVAEHMDILKLVKEGKITTDEAYAIFDQFMDDREATSQPKEYLEFDNYEWTAFAHGASIKTLVRWR